MGTMSERLSIGEFARATGLTPKALRLYDDLGLVMPASVDPLNGYRWYAEDQVEQARLVASLRLIGMPLARIAAVLAGPGSADEIAAYWRQVEADTASRRAIVRTLVQRLHEETTMDANPTPPTLRAGAGHRQGARPSQQDAVLVERGLYAVADGTGERDDLASSALSALSASGLEAAASVARSAAPASATTLTGVRIEGATAALTHVGDGRVHLLRDGVLTLLTRDHTLVADLLERGEITEDEAASHPHRSLLNRALGMSEPDSARVPVRPGDRLVLTTDGVHSVLSAEALAALVAAGDPQEAADAVGRAVEDAGAPDNHSIVVVDLS